MVAAPPTVAAGEPAREVIEAGPAPPVSEGALRGAISSISSVATLSQPDAGLAVAALPPAPPAAAPGALTRTAIPRGGYQITPSYPASARQLGVEGTALLSVFVDAAGHVGKVIVKQSAGHPDLDRAAADAVRRWRFEPARRGAEAVAMWVELPVEFRLR
jgi:protein TonB